MTEIWQPIPGFGDGYEASSDGRIRGIPRIASDGRRLKGKILRQTVDDSGYRRVTLSYAGAQTKLLVHRLIATAFLPNPLSLEQVNHIDGDTNNASVNNLEWCTRSENHKHAYRFLGRKPNIPRTGKTRARAIIGDDGSGAVSFPSTHAAVADGFTQTAICKCLKGRQATHKGFVWRYAA